MPSQPHRKTIKHYHEPGHLHELTFSCYRRLPLLTNNEWKTKLSRCIDKAGEEESFQLAAFVFMPDHVHLLVVPETSDANISRYLARLKQPFSKYVKSQLEESKSPLADKLTVRERPGKTTFRFWQEGPGYDRNLFEPKTIAASLNYLHTNPVTRNLCPRAIDWTWSSARFYHGESPGRQDPKLPTIHGLPPGTLEDLKLD